MIVVSHHWSVISTERFTVVNSQLQRLPDKLPCMSDCLYPPLTISWVVDLGGIGGIQLYTWLTGHMLSQNLFIWTSLGNRAGVADAIVQEPWMSQSVVCILQQFLKSNYTDADWASSVSCCIRPRPGHMWLTCVVVYSFDINAFSTRLIYLFFQSILVYGMYM